MFIWNRWCDLKHLQSLAKLAKEHLCWEGICIAVCREVIGIFMPGSFLVEVGLCLGGGQAGNLGRKSYYVCRIRVVGFGTDRWRPLENKFNKYTVEKDSWGISSGRCTVDRRPPKSTVGVEAPKSHYLQSNFVTKEDLISLRVLQLASETWLFSFHARYSSIMLF